MEDKADRQIQLDDKHWLCWDGFSNYWIVAETKAKNGKPYMKRVSGYCSSFPDAVDSCIEKRIQTAEVNSLKDLADEIKAIKRDLRSWKTTLTKKV